MAHRILLVEDEFSLRLALTDRLRAAGRWTLFMRPLTELLLAIHKKITTSNWTIMPFARSPPVARHWAR